MLLSLAKISPYEKNTFECVNNDDDNDIYGRGKKGLEEDFGVI
jgi:hypothetical protein